MRCKPSRATLLLFTLSLAAAPLRAQAPAGPLPPKPGAPVQEIPQAKAPRIQVRVSLVSTPVTVRDKTGQMIHNLAETEFRVLDNGVPQKITHFDLGGDPLSLVLLFENSSRVAPLLPELRKTGILFTQTVMGPSGEAAVVTFNDSIDKLQDFSTDTESIEKTVAQLKPGTSGAKLYDAMAVAVEMLSGRGVAAGAPAGVPTRRRVLLVISEATDAGSDSKLGEVLRQAQHANVTIYSVGLSTTRAQLQAEPRQTTPHITPPGTFPQPPQPGTVQTPTSEQQRYGNIDFMALVVWALSHVKEQIKDHALEVATTATGGMHLATFRDRSIEKAIDEIGGELHSQYTLSYTPSGAGDYGYHEIKVEISRPGLKVRARPGYYLAAPES
ncbi:MAG: VWA domain-containing protein [Acidobacteriia bacterium]|nr:VWA domain-containing protein [Terriglobia bacterium]